MEEKNLHVEEGALKVTKLTLYEAVAIIVGANVGSGILGLAYSSRLAGWPILVLWLAVAGLFTTFSMLYVAESALRTKKPLQLPGLAEKYVGKVGSVLIFISVCANSIGCMVAYTTGSGNILCTLLGLPNWAGSLLFTVPCVLVVWFGLKATGLWEKFMSTGMVVLQAESEISSINMVYGGASTGKRVMTSSSSPGISLMSEGLSYLAGAELPCLIINCQRGGPGLGSIQPAQSDYNQATHAMGHGDFHILVYAPCSVQEMVDTVTLAFDKADQYRMPAMILADGLLGQMMEPVTFPEPRTTLPDKSDWAANGHGNKREHHIINSLYLDAPLLEAKVQERFKRYAIIEETETDAELYCCDDAEIVVTAYGASARVSKSAVTAARRKGIKAGLCRPKTLWPFPKKELCEATKHASHILDVEMSMGQMIDDVRLATQCRLPVSFFGRTGGVIPTPAEVLAEIEKLAGGAE